MLHAHLVFVIKYRYGAFNGRQLTRLEEASLPPHVQRPRGALLHPALKSEALHRVLVARRVRVAQSLEVLKPLP